MLFFRDFLASLSCDMQQLKQLILPRSPCTPNAKRNHHQIREAKIFRPPGIQSEQDHPRNETGTGINLIQDPSLAKEIDDQIELSSSLLWCIRKHPRELDCCWLMSVSLLHFSVLPLSLGWQNSDPGKL